MIVLYNVIEFLISFVETLICYRFVNLFFKDRLNTKRKKIMELLYSLLITICIFLNNQISLFSNFLLIFVIVVMGISSMLLFKAKFFQSVTVVGVYYLGIMIFDLFSIFIISVLTANDKVGGILISQQGLERILYICAMKLCLIVFYLFLRDKNIKYEVFLKYWGFWLTLCLIGYSALFYFQRFAVRNLTEVLASNWLFFLAILLMFLLLFYMYIKYRDYEEKNAIINVRNEVLEKSYANIRKLYKDNGHVMHDFKNHIAIISNYIRSSDYQKALDYIDSIAQPIRKIENTVWSGIEIVDIVLNCKIAEAEMHNIKVTIDVNIASPRVIDMDFCTILSNLMDNAIEASMEDVEARRYIKFTMKSVNNMLVIKVKNNVAEKPKLLEGSRLETTKKDKKAHGIGLESVEFCVNKYNGNMKFNLGDTYFEVRVLLLST
ncbi:sensor histidine kinase [Blautia caecimuris]|uniref:sensor histidine kinase n=1 Tax=Blautia caecimuris TaxID=1796615 RepID=UPI0034BAF323